MWYDGDYHLNIMIFIN